MARRHPADADPEPIICQHDVLLGEIVALSTELDTLDPLDRRRPAVADRLAEATRKATALWSLIEDAGCFVADRLPRAA